MDFGPGADLTNATSSGPRADSLALCVMLLFKWWDAFVPENTGAPAPMAFRATFLIVVGGEVLRMPVTTLRSRSEVVSRFSKGFEL